MKRVFDFMAAAFGLLLASPVLCVALLAVWLQDYRSPLYIADRVGRGGRIFRMVKIRSMVVGADRSGVDSTSSDDLRITMVGRLIRRFKLDELTQLWNVLKGEMSLVGPRPNVAREVALYTEAEAGLVSVTPGITDFASIIFSDEGNILEGSPDPDLAYNQLIRPWKSQLGLFYIEKQSIWLDIRLIWLTLVSAVSRRAALEKVSALLASLGAGPELVAVALRNQALVPTPPPGSDEIVHSRIV